jgi:hypothetical protein
MIDGVAQAVADEVGVDQRDDSADLNDAEPYREVFRAVGHYQANHLARREALG